MRCDTRCDDCGRGTCTWDEVFLSDLTNTSSYGVRVYPSMSSSSLSHDEATHSASSATRVSFEDLSAGALTPTPSAHSKRPSGDDQHTANFSSEKHLRIRQRRTFSITVSGTEKIEREHALEAISPNEEYLKNSEDKKEVHQENEDPFLVVWDKDDKENPRVRRIQCQDSTHMSFLIHKLLRHGQPHIAGTCTSRIPTIEPLSSAHSSYFAADRLPPPSWFWVPPLPHLLPLE